MSGGPNTLRVYKNLLLLAKRLPKPAERESALQRIRSAFRQNCDASSSEADELVREAEAKISYLKIVTPRSNRAGTAAVGGATSDGASGVKHYVYTGKEGGGATLVHGPGANTKIPLDQRDYSHAQAYANRSIRRQYFMDRGVKNPFSGS